MRASEETFYDVKRLHRLFAVSAVAMLAVTVWMVAADHWRPWKVYQRTFRDEVEPWVTGAAIRQLETDQFFAREEELTKALQEARRAAPEQRVAELRRSVDAARFGRQNAERRLRFRRAELDAARTGYESAVGRGLSPAKLEPMAGGVEQIRRDVGRLEAEARQASGDAADLARTLADVGRPEERARQALAEHRAARDRLQRAMDQQSPSVAKRVLGLPLVDALGRPVAIDQVWLPELTIDYHFRHVARFDRCPTCHAGIGKAAPGSASEPAYRPRERLRIRLVPPKEAPKAPEGVPPDPQEALRAAYGFSLAPRGILDPAEVTVGLVLPQTPAARAGLLAGDALAGVAGQPIGRREDVARLLLGDAAWGKPLEVEVWRGLPHPFRSHARLDLFVGPESPHPLGQFGCTICHDGQGSATEFTFASHTPNDVAQRARWRREHGWSWNPDWDLPMRPARFAESNCLKCHHDVSDLEPSRRFPDPPAEKLLAGYHLVRQSGCFGCHEIRGVDDSGRRIGPDLRPEPAGAWPAGAVPDAAAGTGPGLGPGTLPRVGPSLRSVADKLDAAFVRAWIARPSGFRPDTRMPQFFRLHEHLDGRGLDEARRFEPVEIAAIAEYLRAVSRPVSPLGPLAGAAGAASAPSAERGKRLFQTRGCLACHKHADFPAAQSTQGPDLSRIGAKLSTPAGRKWLGSWLRDPARHSPRTLMPNSLLEEDAKPQAADGAKPQAAAEDIAAYLAESAGWVPEPAVSPPEADVDQLALLHLAKTFPRALAEKYLREGVPTGEAGLAQADAAELAGPVDLAKKLRYLGRRTIRRRGCFGCHDVPGFEDAQPIGPPLSDWGRKQESQLAFEQVHRFVTAFEPGDGFYREALLAKRREGFLWQKLRDPRSFDYKKTANKEYHEHLLMGRFTLTEAQREAILTFVLGLVAEPPAEKYVYRPDRRARAIVEGRKVLDKYGCAQCHTLEMERWTVDVDPAAFPPPPAAAAEYPFLKPDLTAEQLKASAQPDRRGLARVELTGMPQWSAEGRPEETEDDEGNPVVSFVLWEPAAIAGRGWPVGGAGVLVSPGQVARRRPAVGGDYARLLYPVAVAEAKAAGSAATYIEGWGWVPPPLVHEGRKVQPAWLYNFLLNPVAIRPAGLLRMPKYNLSPQEAEKLVDYFAALDGVEFPYTGGPIRPASSQSLDGNTGPEVLDRAFDLVLDRTTYCGKCHLIGDFAPGGEVWTIRAPNLERVGQRIRPEHLRRWLANPKSILPYTAMPVNFPPNQPLRQDLLPGSSVEQLDAVLGLLLDYDQYMKRRTSIRKLIEAGAKPKAEP